LFVALRRLSSVDDARNLIHQLGVVGWPSWDTPGTGPEERLASEPV
jgi:hypothetical protein